MVWFGQIRFIEGVCVSGGASVLGAVGRSVCEGTSTSLSVASISSGAGGLFQANLGAANVTWAFVIYPPPPFARLTFLFTLFSLLCLLTWSVST